MAGMDRHTGRWIGGWPHTGQSLTDVVDTELGSRVLRRMYGSDPDTLQDKPQNRQLITKVVMAIAVPVRRWEPRVELAHVAIAVASVLGRLVPAARVRWLPRALFGDRRVAGEQVAKL
jgi:phage baseplate assembly protein W